MATFDELNAVFDRSAAGSETLRDRVGAACRIAAQTIIAGDDTADPPWNATNHDQRVKWAIQVLTNYESVLSQMFITVVAANDSATQTAILNATDSAIQNNVNEAVDSLSANLV